MKLSELLKKLGVDDPSAATEIEEFITSSVTQKTGNMIPESRFKEVVAERNKLRADAVEIEARLEDATSKINGFADLTAERDDLKAKLDAHAKNAESAKLEKWTRAAKTFEVKEGNANFELIKKLKDSGRFVFAQEGKELTPDQIGMNLLAYETLTEAGVFTPVTPPGSGANTTPAPPPKEVKTDFRKAWGL